MSFSLVALNGPEPGRVHRLSRGVGCTLGSDAACDIRIDGAEVARQHARLDYESGAWQVSVCHQGKHAPTAINSQLVQRSPLQHGDLLAIGDRWLVFSDDQRLGEADGVVLQSCRVLGRRSFHWRREPQDARLGEGMLALVARIAQLASASPIDELAANIQSQLEVSLGDVSVQVAFDLKRGGDPLAQWVRQRGELLVMELGRASVAPVRAIEEKVGVVGVPIFIRGEVSACLELRIANGAQANGVLLDGLLAVAGIVGLRLEKETHQERVAPVAPSFPNPSRGRSRIPIQPDGRRKLPSAAPATRMLGDSAIILRLQEQIRRAAPTDANVLVLGESGTGKELVAQSIHEQSQRRGKAFVAVNCAAFTESLLESELFGHEQGAFTGAEARRIGQFERADAGTIFLDEIGELSSGCQAKLLRLLEGKAFYRVGGVEPVQVNVRIIAATHRNLPQMVADGVFREDLWYRLRVIELQSPPLRQRRDDILRLADHFLNEAAGDSHDAPRAFSEAAAARLQQHLWPGNVRELRNAVERAVVMSQHSVIQPDDLGLDNRSLRLDDSVKDPSVATLAENESRHIARVLELVNGNKTEACRLLDISRTTLYSKLAKRDR